MDPFEPIRVDPDPERTPERQPQPTGPGPGTSRERMEPADMGLGAAQTIILLNAIDQRSDAAVAGAAEVAGHPPAVDADPFDEPTGDAVSAADSGDGCAAGVFAVLLALTAAAGTAAAFVR
jgi:hypothetical protein